MEAKKLLKEYRGIKIKLWILEQEILKFETAAEGMTIQMDGQPKGGGPSDKMAVFSIKAADAERERAELLSELNRRRWEIIFLVSHMEDAKQIKVLHGRYIDDHQATWEQLADDLGLSSVRQVQRIHGEALEELQDVIERRELGKL